MTDIQLLTCKLSKIQSAFHEAAFRLGMPESSLTALYVLYANDGSAEISEVCRLTGIRKQTLNASIRRMELLGLVSLSKGKGKNKIMSLSERGRRTAELTVGRLCAMQEEAAAAWTEEDLERLLSYTDQYSEIFASMLAAMPSEGNLKSRVELAKKVGQRPGG